MNNRQVAHAFAHRKPAKGSNYTTDGETLYSYNTTIARHTKDRKGRPITLLTCKAYSVSTSRHQSYAANAVTHLTTFRVDNIHADKKEQHSENFRTLSENIDVCIGKASRARQTQAYLLECVKQDAEHANRYAEAFGLRQRVKLPDDMVAMVAEVKERQVKEEKRNATRRKKEDTARQHRAATALAEWLAGGGYGYDLPRYTVYLRLKDGGDTIETSRGAEFPVTHAKRAFRLIQKVRERQQPWHKNGESCPVGLFQVESIDSNGDVVAGCHVIRWAQIEDMARQLGLLETENAD